MDILTSLLSPAFLYLSQMKRLKHYLFILTDYYSFSPSYQQLSSLDYQIPSSHLSAPPLPPKYIPATHCPSPSSQSQAAETKMLAKHFHSGSVGSVSYLHIVAVLCLSGLMEVIVFSTAHRDSTLSNVNSCAVLQIHQL